MVLAALGSIQRFVTLHAIAAEEPIHILRVLSIQAHSSDDEICIKVLQTLPLLLTPSSYVVDASALSAALSICFEMLEHRSPTIRHTSQATLRQVVSLMFDRVEHSMRNEQHTDEQVSAKFAGSSAEGGLMFLKVLLIMCQWLYLRALRLFLCSSGSMQFSHWFPSKMAEGKL